MIIKNNKIINNLILCVLLFIDGLLTLFKFVNITPIINTPLSPLSLDIHALLTAQILLLLALFCGNTFIRYITKNSFTEKKYFIISTIIIFLIYSWAFKSITFNNLAYINNLLKALLFSALYINNSKNKPIVSSIIYTTIPSLFIALIADSFIIK